MYVYLEHFHLDFNESVLNIYLFEKFKFSFLWVSIFKLLLPYNRAPRL